ncbi:MAG: VTT domain-containing protein [Candidatus Nanoarchaeia archaeon]|nr:VTT domain-containing protein [Candidatus Nanoarchaeia archaeon]
MQFRNYKLKLSMLALLIGLGVGIYMLSAVIAGSWIGMYKPSIISFVIVHFLGYLFFILSPVELLFMYFVGIGTNIPLLIFLALVTAIAAQSIDYLIGYFVSDKILISLIGEKRYKKTKRKIDKYNELIIFLFNLSPLSSPIAVLIAGMLGYKLKKVLAYSFMGLLLKYCAIALILVKIM